MNVSNRKCIRHLSFRTLWASRKRNLIAILAITLTTLLFTSLFTIAMSLNSSYEEYTFRQIGGYSHGTFKEVTEEQVQALSSHSKVKAAGVRTAIGYCTTEPFAKVIAEVSYMDANTTKWYYCTPTVGRMPEGGKEIAMDTRALELLGVKPELGAQVTLTWQQNSESGIPDTKTDTFTVVGWWEFDDLCPAHFLNVSEEYAKQASTDFVTDGGKAFRTDLNVMLASSINIRGVMEAVDTDLGYQWETPGEDNYVRIGVNWGYTSSELGSNIDPQIVLTILAFVVLITFTGYLIIYNIFQISVTGDIRFYGLLKTIGVTPRQLRRIIRQQGLLLSFIGIPFGLLGGYAAGALLTPVVLSITDVAASAIKVSVSPFIFIGAALFALITVFLSCARPGKMAARVSPVEAAKYTQVNRGMKKKRAARGAKVHQMAWANLGRSKSKTVLVVLSLSLSVVLLTMVYSFTAGFDMDKYLARSTAADFIVGTTEYFRYQGGSGDAALDQQAIEQIRKNTESSLDGAAYVVSGARPQCWISEDLYRTQMSSFISGEQLERVLQRTPRQDNLLAADMLIEGLDEALLSKLTVLEGDLSPLSGRNSHAVAIQASVDDYDKPYGEYPQIGDVLPVTYIEEAHYIDSRTGEPCDETTPEEYLQYKIIKSHTVEYTVCALVTVPYSMGFRFTSGSGYAAVLPAETLKIDSGMDTYPMFYMLDTPDEKAEADAENFIRNYTEEDSSGLMYESKQSVREEFENFRHMFVLMGGMLCFIVGLVGVLNFFNAIMTGILSRRREFAMLQAIGMTSKQLRQMLVYEGLFYALGAVVFSLVLALILEPLTGNLVENMFWFFRYHFTITPVLLVAPVFTLLGFGIPLIIYQAAGRETIVERLRESEGE